MGLANFHLQEIELTEKESSMKKMFVVLSIALVAVAIIIASALVIIKTMKVKK